MTWLVQTRLINDPFGDPGLFVDFRHERRALLFDLGDLSALSPRELLRVSHAFVSHAHMDHFVGFDRLLGICLHRHAPLHLAGPRGFADRVAAKLAAYTWNLLDESAIDFAMVVDEFDGRVARRFRFGAREAFAPRELERPSLPDGLVLAEDQFRIEAAILDHGTPCLAFALQERLQVNVWRDGLAGLGLPVGPWLNEAKRAVRRGEADDVTIAVDDGRAVSLGELKLHALRIAPGQRVVYVVDAAPHEDNIQRAVRLSRGASQLYIEAAFADQDAGIAAQRLHLTAGVAGQIGRRAGVRQVIPLHFSPRYRTNPELIPGQVDQAFRATDAVAAVSPAG